MYWPAPPKFVRQEKPERNEGSLMAFSSRRGVCLSVHTEGRQAEHSLPFTTGENAVGWPYPCGHARQEVSTFWG